MEPIVGNGIMLRPFEDCDVQQFVAAVRESSATLGEWMPWWKDDYSGKDAEEWFEHCHKGLAAGDNYDIGMFLPDSVSFIGGISINHIDRVNKIGSVGYWVRESRQNMGFCSSAVTAITRFGFATLGLVRLEIVVLVENAASRRVAEKCGAKLDCVAQNRLFNKGAPMAAAVYSLVHP